MRMMIPPGALSRKLTYEELCAQADAREFRDAYEGRFANDWFDFLESTGWTGAELRERVMEERQRKHNPTPCLPCSLCNQHHDTREVALACFAMQAK